MAKAFLKALTCFQLLSGDGVFNGDRRFSHLGKDAVLASVELTRSVRCRAAIAKVRFV